LEEVIPTIVTYNTNQILTMLPSLEELHNDVFSLHKESSPRPDGFGAVFFQTYWYIIKSDVERGVLQFFESGWIMPNFNSNTVAQIPKTHNVDTMSQLRPIEMTNFKFKIISKIIVDMLVQLMPTLISKERERLYSW